MSSPGRTDFPFPEHAGRLSRQADALQAGGIISLFEEDPSRAARYRAQACDWELDYSRHLLDDSARETLLDLGQSAGLSKARDALFEGAPINHTEQRPALHTLLRADAPGEHTARQWDAVQECLGRLEDWVNRVHSGEHTGHSGERITHVINLGIGGSDLGPRMVVQALRPWHTGHVEVRFCANIDPAELGEALSDLDPAKTLFIVCSKSLRTEETLKNAELARRWLLDSGAPADAVEHHFLAVSTNLPAAADFGIPERNILPLWDWVGGRYSLWSAVGWSIAFAVGSEGFARLRAGGAAMDRHFRETALAENLPVLMSLLELWYVNFLGARSHAVIAYDHRLRRFPAFLQQLSMESNGKQCNRAGDFLNYATAPVLWGDEGSNGQHSYHQLLHQGTLLCPVDFILPLCGQPGDDEDAHRRLVANCLSQGQALLVGRDLEASRQSLLDRGLDAAEADQLAPHLVIPGNRPSSTLSCEQMSPERLGALIALYEHKTFCSGHLWEINSFDQWGVELGKELGGSIYRCMETGEAQGRDASTDALLARWRSAVDKGQ